MSIVLFQARPVVFKLCVVESMLFSNTIVKGTQHVIYEKINFPQEVDFSTVCWRFIVEIIGICKQFDHRSLRHPCVIGEKHRIIFVLLLSLRC